MATKGQSLEAALLSDAPGPGLEDILAANGDLARRLVERRPAACYDPAVDLLFVRFEAPCSLLGYAVDTIVLYYHPSTLRIEGIEVLSVRALLRHGGTGGQLLRCLMQSLGAGVTMRLDFALPDDSLATAEEIVARMFDSVRYLERQEQSAGREAIA